jgi:hypothetical protein
VKEKAVKRRTENENIVKMKGESEDKCEREGEGCKREGQRMRIL